MSSTNMKLSLVSVLAILLLSSCGPNVAVIERANNEAEASARRADTAAADAEKAANEAVVAADRAQQAAAVAQDAVNRANDVVARFCSVPQPSVGTGESARWFHEVYEAVRFRCGP